MAMLKVLKNGQPIKEVEFNRTEGLLVGRSDQCQLVLDDEVMSRSHFKISYEDNQWRLERLSKYGALLVGDSSVTVHTLKDTDSFAVPPYVFIFEDREFIVSSEGTVDQGPTAEDRTPAVYQGTAAKPESESTSLEVVRAVAYVTVKRAGQEESLRLEGQSWIAGRDESCELYIADPRCSRQHCRIFRDGVDYYVVDNGSSNGTTLNSQDIKDKPVRLESGDQIEIGDSILVFELRDPLYEQMMNDIQAPVSDSQAPVMYVPVSLSPVTTGPAAVRIDQPFEDDSKAKRTKMIRLALVAFIGLAVLFALTDESSQQKSMASKKPNQGKKADPFSELSPADQEMVKRTYTLAKNLFMQTKYELALAEIRKVHEKIPAYLDSKDIESLSQNAMQTIANKKYEEELERRQKEALDKAKKTALECQAKFAKSTDLSGAEACLAPALEFDPENEVARKTVEGIRNLIEQRELEKNNRAEFQRRVRNREALFERARQLEGQGRLMDAIDAYNRHIASTLPDPKNLEDQSKKGIQSVKSRIKTEMDRAIRDSEDHLANAEYRDAILKLEKALELEPNNERARQIYETASKELFKKMKALFSDSVVEESLGNVEPAKVKWRRIVEQDVPKGEYRQKATIKLKKYGE